MENSSKVPDSSLIWIASKPETGNRTIVHFFYAPGLGLTDFDFHPFNEQGWRNMAAPTPDAIAELEVPADLPIAELLKIVQLIRAKGSYQTVVITTPR